MAITLTRQPEEIVWSRNPIVFEFTTDNRFSQIGRPFIGNLKFNMGASANEYLTLSWGTEVYDFAFSDTPDDSGLELPSYQPETDLVSWVSQIAFALLAFYPFYETFSIVQNENTLIITSKEKNSNANLESMLTPVGSELETIQLAISEKLRENFALFVEILVHGSSFSTSVVEFDENDTAIWDVQEYLTAALQSQTIFPKLNEISSDIFSAKTFQLRFAEMYGYPQQLRSIATSPIFIAVHGGVDPDYLFGRSLPDSFKNEKTNYWIVNDPSIKMLATQYSFASIINWSNLGGNDFSLNIRVEHVDRLTKEYALQMRSWEQYEKWIVPIGIPQLSALFNESFDDIKSYAVWIGKGEYPISNTLYIEIESDYKPYSKTLLFLNSMGCYESVYTTGKTDHNYEVEKLEKAFSQFDASNRRNQIQEIDIEIRDQILIHSGYRSHRDIKKFRDFILSKSKYLWDNGKWLPVVLDSTSIAEYQDGNHLHAISFSIKYANEQTLFSQ